MSRPAARDPGLQPERTRLAWRRTVLSHAVVVLLLARLAARHGTLGALVAGVGLTGWALVVVVTYPRMTGAGPAGRDRIGPDAAGREPAGSAGAGPGGRETGRTGPVRPGAAVLPLTAAVAVGYAVLGALLILR